MTRLRASRFGGAPACGLRPLSLDRASFGLRLSAFGLVLIATVSCGKKGPPLAPIVMAPAAVGDLSARRFGDTVVVRFTAPDRNTNNSTPADLARVDVYALSVARAAEAADPAVVIREGTRVATLDTAPKSGATGSTGSATPRVFTETLTDEVRETWKGSKGSTGAGVSTGSAGSAGLTGSPPGTDEATAPLLPLAPLLGLPSPEVAPPPPMRVYVVVPVSSRGRLGPAATVAVPLAAAPPTPPTPAIAYTETTITLTWLSVDGVKTYNVYERAPDPAAALPGGPLNAAPLGEPAFEDKRLEFGKTRCYSVTSVALVADRGIESPLSDPACATPADTFAPAPPTGLAAVAGPGTISLIWDASTAADLAGYLVLRGDAPDDTLQTLTPEPIKETTYRDAAVTTGVRYVYVVVAVDTSKNTSARSSRVEETAR